MSDQTNFVKITANGSNHQAIRILLVEDNLAAQKSTEAILISLNCHVDIANSGIQALNFFKPGKYDLIFMDIGLPDISGYSVTNQIRQLENSSQHRTPIIALTTHADSFTPDDYINMGIKTVIAKPLSKQTAKHIIDQNINLAITDNPQPSHLTLAVIEEGANKEVLDLLNESLLKSCDELDIAYHTKNIPTFINIIHKLHGGLCYSNTPQLRNAAYNLENSLRNGEILKFDKLYENFLDAKRNFEAAYSLL